MRTALPSILAVVVCFVSHRAMGQSPGSFPPKTSTTPLYGRPTGNVPQVAPIPAPPNRGRQRPNDIERSQQLVIVISKNGLMFPSSQNGKDISDKEIPSDDDNLHLACDTVHVIRDAGGHIEVFGDGAVLIKWADMMGTADSLTYCDGKLLFGGNAVINRFNSARIGLTVRDNSFNIDLNKQQIRTSDGSIIHLSDAPKEEPKEEPNYQPKGDKE